MERIDERTQSLTTHWSPFDLSANETKARAYSPTRPRPASRSNRPDTYERLLLSLHASLAKRSRSIHWVDFSGSHPSRKGGLRKSIGQALSGCYAGMSGPAGGAGLGNR